MNHPVSNRGWLAYGFEEIVEDGACLVTSWISIDRGVIEDLLTLAHVGQLQAV